MDVLDYRSAQLLGLGERDVRRSVQRGELERLRPGAFIAPGHDDHQARHRALTQATARRLGPSTVVSHLSAAIMHGLPVLRGRLDGRVHVTRTRSSGARTDRLHARHGRLRDEEIVDIDGVPTTSLARTVADLASELPFSEGLALADAAGRLGLQPPHLLAANESAPAVRQLATWMSPLAESIGESVSRAALISAGLPRPRLQVEIRTDDGRLVARPDFLFDDAAVIGEFDGLVKYAGVLDGSRSPQDVIRAEKQREEELRDLGHDVVRWGWAIAMRPPHLVHRVRLALDRGLRSRRIL